MAELLDQLIKTFGPERVWTGDALTGRGTSYLEKAPLRARALLLPACTEDVAGMMRLCCAAGQPVVPQGGLTNLVYNTHTGEREIAMSLERMCQVEEIDPVGATMTVQAGAVLEHVQAAAENAGLFFPLDLPAREAAVIGGLVGNNAGGLRVVRYGMMREMILGMEAVLADGTVLDMMNKMLKKNAGYDLKQLFIGSEGTLGVVTRVVLRLQPRPQAAATALLGLDQFEQVAALLVMAKRVLGGQLASYEVLWNDFYRLTTTPPAPAVPPLEQHWPYYVLVECLGQEPQEEQARMGLLLDQARAAGLVRADVMALSPAQRADLWRVREDTRQIEAKYERTFGFDVSLPIVSMEGYVRQIRAELAAAFGPVDVHIFGHLADGNLHIHVWGAGIDEAKDHARVETIVYQPLQALGGSISAEHGIGLRKKPYLHYSRTPEEIALMRQLKAALDPRGILNPGKIIDPAG
jgi:FAD/FMN-containing dehydrogenase